jgi:hypothetical protein
VAPVHYDEGIANRIGPEPCAGVHEGTREGVHGGVGEASVGECIGQPLSRVRFNVPGAQCVMKEGESLPCCVRDGSRSLGFGDQ